jgi:hypothetical protein
MFEHVRWADVKRNEKVLYWIIETLPDLWEVLTARLTGSLSEPGWASLVRNNPSAASPGCALAKMTSAL